MTIITDAEIDRHRSRDDDEAETICAHLLADIQRGGSVPWYFLPADSEQFVPSLHCCRECCELHLSEGSQPRAHA